MKKTFTKLLGILLAGIAFFGCKSEDSEPFTGIKFDISSGKMNINDSKTLTATFYQEDVADKTVDLTISILNDSTEGAFIETSGTTSKTVKSGTSVEVTAGSKAGSSFSVSATYSTYTASAKFSTRGENEYIRIADKAIGFANVIDTSKFVNEITVSTAADLQKYSKIGGYVIYVNGVIDMSGGLLPAVGKTSTDFGSAMDAWVAENNTTYKTYKEWFNAKSNCSSSSGQDVDSLSRAFTNLTRITVASNTAIIGLDGAVIRGGNISIGSVSNVVIRNLTLQDGIDPFPHHEKDDGFNAQNDCIGIAGGSNIWIDHCTLEDTLHCGTAANGEKWQVYDGLCDMKSSCTNITVSYCHFKHHDKTMLIGSSDTDGDNTKRFVTLAGNYFENCGQRLPMVRNTRIHVYGNYYENDGSWYRSQSSINARKNAIVCEHNNTFASGASPSTKDGYIYNDVSKIFDVAPRYEFDSISPSKENAGAGIFDVIINK